ncbi:protein cutoff [Drosophila albomicans]|uniref:Decapping nuclease n=1 Tax=Drosophila albomicans TaxID=7291 RepID=A0A6P8XFN1_DROAB|nr:protein cutoff [Drosophila albomicans]
MYSNYKLLEVKLRMPNDEDTFPVVKEPINVGVYSVSPEGVFENCNKRMRFFQPLVTCPFALGANENLLQDEDVANRSYLDTLLLFLTSTQERRQMIRNTEFVCSRDVLVLLLCTPYDRKKKWSIAVSKYRNTIYMCLVPDEDVVEQLDNRRIRILYKNSLLKKLQQHCLVSRVEDLNRIEDYEQRTENGQLYGVFKTTFGDSHLLFDAPVIAENTNNYALNGKLKNCSLTNTDSIGQPTTFVDLRLRQDTMSGPEWVAHYTNEMILWWAECFLTGIKTIHVAQHDKDLIVKRFHDLVARDFHLECKKHWSSYACANFMSRFLMDIKKLMAPVDSPNAVYMVEYDPKGEGITYRVEAERNEHTFIPDWYTKKFKLNGSSSMPF